MEIELPINIDDYSISPKDYFNLANQLKGVNVNLSVMAFLKGQAMLCRERGDIEGALNKEAGIECRYQRLPEELKW